MVGQEQLLEELNRFPMSSSLFTTLAYLNRSCSTTALMDDGCNTYAIVSERLARRAQLERLQLGTPIVASSFCEQLAGTIREVAIIESLDIGGSEAKHGRVFAYIVKHMEGE